MARNRLPHGKTYGVCTGCGRHVMLAHISSTTRRKASHFPVGECLDCYLARRRSA